MKLQHQKNDTTYEQWEAGLSIHPKTNQIESTGKNLKLILLNDPKLSQVRYNRFTKKDETNCPDFKNERGNLIDDESIGKMALYIEETYGLYVPQIRILEMLKTTATERSFHPIKAFIQSEIWDGKERIDTVIIRYLKGKDDLLTRAQTRKWMIAAVARIFDPGCKFDHVLTLSGPEGAGKSTFFKILAKLTRAQTRKWMIAAVARIFDPGCKFDHVLTLSGPEGAGKSTFFKILANGEWFTDSFSFKHDDKTKVEEITGHWIVELSELSGMDSKQDPQLIKAFLSREKDEIRPAYARKCETIPRSNVFAGSTNQSNFLQNCNGNRRWWIIPIQSDEGPESWQAALKAEVPQLWAEAYHYYQEGEPIFLSKEMEAAARRLQEQFTESQWQAALKAEVPQLWAEAYHYYQEGEPIFLSKEMEAAARRLQEQFTESQADELLDDIEAFLERPVPSDYDRWSIPVRLQWQQWKTQQLDGLKEAYRQPGTHQLTIVSARMIKEELPNELIRTHKRYGSKYINSLMAKFPNWQRSEQEKVSGLPPFYAGAEELPNELIRTHKRYGSKYINSLMAKFPNWQRSEQEKVSGLPPFYAGADGRTKYPWLRCSTSGTAQ